MDHTCPVKLTVKPASYISSLTSCNVAPKPFYLISFKVSFVHCPKCIYKLSFSVDCPEIIVSFMNISVLKPCLTEAMFLVVTPFAYIRGSTSILIRSKAMFFVVFPIASISISIGKYQCTLSMSIPALYIAFVFRSITKINHNLLRTRFKKLLNMTPTRLIFRATNDFVHSKMLQLLLFCIQILLLDKKGEHQLF